jgi:hypothetical protein
LFGFRSVRNRLSLRQLGVFVARFGSVKPGRATRPTVTWVVAACRWSAVRGPEGWGAGFDLRLRYYKGTGLNSIYKITPPIRSIVTC